MIYRVKDNKGTSLDFGSAQAANQLIDNYPPYVRERVVVKEITLSELKASIDRLTSELSRVKQETTHADWLLSRIEFYQDALPGVEQFEAQINAKVASLPTWDAGFPPPPINEVWQ